MRNRTRLRQHASALLCAIAFGLAVAPVSDLLISHAAWAQAPTATDAETTVAQQSALAFYYGALGPFYTIIFLAISFIFVATSLAAALWTGWT